MSSATGAIMRDQKPAATPGTTLSSGSSSVARNAVLCLLLFLITLAVYNPVVHNGFTNYDDDWYILHNPHVQAGLTWQTVKWTFTTFYVTLWHPLTWLSHALDCQIFHLNPAGHHYVSVLLHAGSAILLFLLLEGATGLAWPSLMVAALFALHPVNVESVAWVAERKNVLSAFFFLLAMHAYSWYVRRVSIRRYVGVASLFALGLMSKPEIVTLPFVLLLWDYWPLHRMWAPPVGSQTQRVQPTSFGSLLLEKIPLLLLSAASGVLTVLAQRSGPAMPTLEFRWRIGNAIVAYLRYLAKAFWPTRLAVMYPHPGLTLAPWKIVASSFLLLLLTGIVLWLKSRRYLAMGWFWFLGTLVPVIGIVQSGQQAMADRYAYLPYIGLFVMAIWAASEAAHRRKRSAIWVGIPVFLLLAVFGWLTDLQLSYWRSSETLMRHTLSVTQNNYVAHDVLARALVAQGRSEEAIVEFKAADRLNCYTPQEMLEVGLYEHVHGHTRDSIDEYGRALDRLRDPQSRAIALSLLGSAFVELADFERAKQSYTEALRENPNNSSALIGSGLVAEHDGDDAFAVSQISQALRLEPSDVGYLVFAQILRRHGRSSEAVEAEMRAQQISRNLTQAQRTAAQMLNTAGVLPVEKRLP